ncbi:uncharacterized protein BP01DRAFT_190654 [Aspergillus saccharolyticus JOP 1030-1]|uniref:Uncharacterized protein n=1 Tax=Aspergillus saccharolyticus JOP 1030-1 TaxID=1450539 RepID=A0A318Z1X8_9EURO|nr:hypothetical protein BP01DRAFT_190654 [Aspergillus saccharolyticus JOP 1030-1]PYH40929.1 hypothetical protein BP01DRAFT_190654 [Aspergillus saccharolyticus JOP 1030-1]
MRKAGVPRLLTMYCTSFPSCLLDKTQLLKWMTLEIPLLNPSIHAKAFNFGHNLWNPPIYIARHNYRMPLQDNQNHLGEFMMVRHKFCCYLP